MGRRREDHQPSPPWSLSPRSPPTPGGCSTRTSSASPGDRSSPAVSQLLRPPPAGSPNGPGTYRRAMSRSYARWSDVRARGREADSRTAEEQAAGKAAAGERREAYVRGHQLAEIRTAADVTQAELSASAERLVVTPGGNRQGHRDAPGARRAARRRSGTPASSSMASSKVAPSAAIGRPGMKADQPPASRTTCADGRATAS